MWVLLFCLSLLDTDDMFRTLFTKVSKNDSEDIYEVSGVPYPTEWSAGCQSRTPWSTPLEPRGPAYIKEYQRRLHCWERCIGLGCSCGNIHSLGTAQLKRTMRLWKPSEVSGCSWPHGCGPEGVCSKSVFDCAVEASWCPFFPLAACGLILPVAALEPGRETRTFCPFLCRIVYFKTQVAGSEIISQSV